MVGWIRIAVCLWFRLRWRKYRESLRICIKPAGSGRLCLIQWVWIHWHYLSPTAAWRQKSQQAPCPPTPRLLNQTLWGRGQKPALASLQAVLTHTDVWEPLVHSLTTQSVIRWPAVWESLKSCKKWRTWRLSSQFAFLTKSPGDWDAQ